MPTQKPRLNLVLDPFDLEIISRFAKKTGKSIAGAGKELILKALELEEDFYFSKESEKRLKEDGKRYSHEEAWK